MRRLIAYITMAISMLIAIGVAATPVLTKLNNGREFTQGREIVFKLEPNEGEELADDAAEKVADEMRTRLANFAIEDYSVKIQGKDTVTASFAVEKDEFDYVAKYLCFSGENFVFSSKTDTSITDKLDTKDFQVADARIEYVQDTIPVIVIPVKDTAKTALENIIKELHPDTETGGEPTKAFHYWKHDAAGHPEEGEEGGTETEQPTPDIFLWANYDEINGDSYELVGKDPIVTDKIIMSFISDNIWYEKSKEEKTEIAFYCATANSEGQLDISGLKNDNVRANYLLNMLHSPAYEVNVTCPTRNVTQQGIDYYTNSTEVEPSAESLLVLGSNVNIAMSATFIASIIAVIIVALLLIVYYRINAIAMIATTASTLFITLLAFKGMNVLFNIPAIVGLLILTGGILFSEIIYVNRFKEEVYKGRSIKKANQEASKKSNLLTLDASIILAFSGLMMYVLGGDALKPLGVVLFFGAIFALLMNLLIFKAMMYLVTNATNLQTKYKAFNIEENKIPNLLNGEEKPSYEGAYEKVDFTKKKKLSAIIFGALALASIAVISVFGAIDGSPLNVKNATKDTTVIYTELRENNLVGNEEDFKNYILKDLKADETTSVEASSVELKKVSTFEYEEGSENTPKISYFFITKIDRSFSEEQLANIEDNINNVLADVALTSEDIYTLEVKNSKELVYTPNQGSVALATGIAIVGVAFYACFRFRPSRGISLLVSTAGATAIAYGVMVATRIGTTAVTSLAMPLVAVSMMLASLFYLSTEKAMKKEFAGELTPEARNSIMVKALGKSASPMLVFMLITIYIAINYFGFGLSQTAYLFASALIGEIVAVVVLLTILGPLSGGIEKLLSKIHLPKLKIFEKKEKDNTPKKRNSSEPEETIFIGIND